jgi:hypothetical protein
MSTHNHHWVYLCDALLSYTEKDLQAVDAEPKKLLYCMHCGTAGVQFGNKIAVVESTLTRDFLKNFEKTTNQVVKKPPPEFLFRPSKVLPPRGKRLGRGLTDLLKQGSPANLWALFPIKKDS